MFDTVLREEDARRLLIRGAARGGYRISGSVALAADFIYIPRRRLSGFAILSRAEYCFGYDFEGLALFFSFFLTLRICAGAQIMSRYSRDAERI